MLNFSPANAKIRTLSQIETLNQYLHNGRKVYSFDIISGWSCPFAKDCLAKVHVNDGKRKLVDGPDMEFRCFSASQEVLFTNVYKMRNNNYLALKQKNAATLALTLLSELPINAGIIRMHVAGDFFSQAYFDAWTIVAKMRPNVLFYAYTKSLPYWVNRLGDLPENLVLTASRGGRCDNLIGEHNLRCVEVVYSVAEAKAKKLAIDHDDSHAARPDMRHNNFALLIHGVQPAGSKASKALKLLDGLGSYSR